jgi:ADP-ribose pyrophosphatase
MNHKSIDIEAVDICFKGFFRMEKYRLRHSLFSGGQSKMLTRELFERGNAVAVLLYDPQQDTVVLVEQFRIGAIATPKQAWLIEIVAGIFDEGETPEDVAIREAEEEAGCSIKRLEHIADYYVSPGGTSEKIHLYCGQIDSAGVGGVHGLAEEGEDILVQVVATETALAWVAEGKICSANPIIALQWLALNRDLLRQRWLDPA